VTAGPDARRPEALYGIGEVAARAGVSGRTLRYYEEIGLIRPHSHRPGGLRRYSEDDIQQVRRIRELQNLMGFNLEEIRAVVSAERRLDALRHDYRSSTAAPRQREVLDEAAGVLDRLRQAVTTKIDALERFRSELDDRVARNRRKLDELDELDEEGTPVRHVDTAKTRTGTRRLVDPTPSRRTEA
jgi:DNA-binding transcriptional MerR regulator